MKVLVGALDVKKAQALGAKNQQLGQLKAGLDIKLENGTEIKSADCVLPATKGGKFVLLQV